MNELRKADLARISVLYLALPNGIFLLGWLRWYIGLPVALLLALAWLRPAGGSRVSTPGLLFAMAAALAVLLQSGVGGFGPQDADWLKHNAVLKDLITNPWPVTYEVDGERLALVYYVAYYLPAALVGKLAGWQAANLALFAWSWLGLVLALPWFQTLVGRGEVWATVLFLAFSGLDIAGLLFGTVPSWWHIEWWAGHWSYQSAITQLWWVPQIALGGWIATALLVNSIEQGRSGRDGLFLLGLTPLYSPFVTLGVLMFLVADWVRRRIRSALTLQNCGGAVLLLLFGLYFTAKFAEGMGVRGLIYSTPMKDGPVGWWQITVAMAVFWLVEFGAYGLLIRAGARGGWLLAATMAILMALPFYRYGHYNDLVMRASIPALFVLAVLVGRVVLEQTAPVWRRRLLVILLIAGSVTPLVEWKRHAGIIRWRGSIRFPVPERVVKSLPEVHVETYAPAGIPFLQQYTGSLDAPFFAFLARRTTP